MESASAPDGGNGRESYLEGFARRLRQARTIVESNQAEVARRTGVSSASWHKYEHAKHEMRTETLAAFCLIYRICPRWLILGELGETMPQDRRELLLLRYPENPEFRARRESGALPRSTQTPPSPVEALSAD